MVHSSSTRFSSKYALQMSAHVLLALLVLLPSFSFAVDGTLTNEQTGSGSQNTNDVTDIRDVSATFGNTATVDNAFNLNLNTGGNTIRDNTTVGDVTTGDVGVDIASTTTVNSANTNALTALLGTGDSLVEGSNTTTGSNSQNTNQFSTTRTITFQQQNTLSVTNTVTAAIDTGNNTIADNTTVGDITTGTIDVTVDVDTQGNTGGGFLPDDEDGDTENGGGSSQPGPVTIAQLPPTQISAATAPTAKTTSKSVAQGGGAEFFPAGTDGQFGLQLIIFALLAIVIVRFQELSSTLFARLQHRTVPIRVQ